MRLAPGDWRSGGYGPDIRRNTFVTGFGDGGVEGLTETGRRGGFWKGDRLVRGDWIRAGDNVADPRTD